MALPLLRPTFVRLLAAGALALCGCTGGSPFAGGSKGDTNAKPPKDTGKPTEDSEGVPGYLTDPGRVVFTGGRVQGEPGAVAAESGDLTSVSVTVWQGPAGPDDGCLAADETAGAAAIGTGRARADGSFEIALSGAVDQAFVVVATTVRPFTRVRDTDDKARAVIATRTQRVFSPLACRSGQALGVLTNYGALGTKQRRAAELCLGRWADQPFVDGDATSVRVITPNAQGDGTDLVDAARSGLPELILIDSFDASGVPPDYALRNPNGWYCLAYGSTGDMLANVELGCGARFEVGAEDAQAARENMEITREPGC